MTGALRLCLPAVLLASLVGGSTLAVSTASSGTPTRSTTAVSITGSGAATRSTAPASTGGSTPAGGPPAAARSPVTARAGAPPSFPTSAGGAIPTADPVPSSAAGPTSAQLTRVRATLGGEMRRAGSASGAYVVDLTTGQVLYSIHPTTPRIPASVEKLYTTSTVLARFGPTTRLSTSVLGVGSADDKGVWKGNLYVHGGGDPTFGTDSPPGSQATPTTLASTLLAATGITRVDGSVIGDETLFDSLRGVPSSGYLADPVDLAGELSALADDRGRLGGLSSPAVFAASQVAKALRASGVAVTGRTTAGPTPKGARLLAAVQSPDLATIVALTDQPSDNLYAETLLKDLGAYFGSAGSSAAGAAVVRAWLAPLGIRPHLVDGSGLSDTDRTSPEQVVTLLRDLNPTAADPLAPVGAALMAALPVAGRSGTLVDRMRKTAAAGRCEAKTGTLSGVSNLAGVCDGRYAFAFLMNQISDAKAHALQDAMTEAIAALPG
ncbi:MAG TPA: D-alanyl-D-alanine carboxypeptidase/D-alanyl-D-alanine-endopeptidase [Solirubrobacteraceae bacterium]|nr:D-alanyl-D-alanine carboxypeptidase/D-alanyl-D-alanine-endopeptidase [Solirubrobacteraceae bacterium]